MMMRYSGFLAAALGLCGITPSAQASVQVTIGNLNLAPGGTGTLNVNISSSTAPA